MFHQYEEAGSSSEADKNSPSAADNKDQQQGTNHTKTDSAEPFFTIKNITFMKIPINQSKFY
jgi:hypothetical protein